MSTAGTNITSAADAQNIWQQIRMQLEDARQCVSGEISRYPAPRPACDADFNHLLEQRAQISDEINRLHAAAGAPSADARREIEAFVSASEYLDDARKRQFKSMLDELPRADET